ncbi:MAG TPA: hypothetical protein VKV40_14005 [Ktedonobacteraceae bacterium]|nr:hypothetical protein [Ktedonobacteraceae bacterium]
MQHAKKAAETDEEAGGTLEVIVAGAQQDACGCPFEGGKCAPDPHSPARRLFSDELIAAHLDALAAAQQKDGGWQCNWFAWNPVAALEWRGVVTIEAPVMLRNYRRQF